MDSLGTAASVVTLALAAGNAWQFHRAKVKEASTKRSYADAWDTFDAIEKCVRNWFGTEKQNRPPGEIIAAAGMNLQDVNGMAGSGKAILARAMER